MSVRTKTNLTLVITLAITVGGWVWVAATKSADVEQLKEKVTLLTVKHDDGEKRINDVSGDVKVIKAILERIEGALRKP